MSESTDNKVSHFSRHRPSVVAGVALLSVFVFFWPTLSTFPETWTRYYWRHGWLIAVLVGWLIWRDRRKFTSAGGRDPVLLLPIAALSLVWFAVIVAHIQVFHQLFWAAVLTLWAILLFGRGNTTSLIALGVTALLAVPVWELLLPILRLATTLASGGLVNLVGIPADIQGDLIHIAAGSFQIAGGCSGLSYLMAGLVVAAFYAHFLVKDRLAQLAVTAVAAAIAIVGNWIRVTTVIVLGHFTDMNPLWVGDHGWQGWVIFTIGLLPFFFIARRIEKLGIRRAARKGADAVQHTEGSERGKAGMLPNRAVAGTAAAVLGPALYLIIGAIPATHAVALDLGELARSEGWSLADATANRVFDWHPAYQGAARHDTASFTNGTFEVYADHFVYREQAQGAKLIGYPNSITAGSDLLSSRLIGPVDADRRRWVQQAVIRTPEGVILTWYWYRVGGVETFWPVYAKLLEIPAFLRRVQASELIAFSAACGPEDCANAFEALAGFFGTPTRSTNQLEERQDTSG